MRPYDTVIIIDSAARKKEKKSTCEARKEGKNNFSSRTGEEQQQNTPAEDHGEIRGLWLVGGANNKNPITIWNYVDFRSTVPGTTSTVPGFKKNCAMFFHAIYLTVDHTQILQTCRPCVALLLVL